MRILKELNFVCSGSDNVMLGNMSMFVLKRYTTTMRKFFH